MMILARAAALLLLLLAPLATAHSQDPTAPASSIARAAAARIAPGDRIVVRVWQEPDLSDTAAVVNERSEVVLPRLGVVSVASHSAVSLRDTLRAQYATFLRNPVVDVAVFRRVVVNGEVGSPGVYHVDIATALRDVIAEAGGITSSGDSRKVEIIRGAQRIRVPGWQRLDSSAADLRSGDQVVVGRRNWFAANALSLTGTLVAVASLLIAFR